MREAFWIILISAAFMVVGVLRVERWKKKHKNDPAPQAPVVAGVSAFTGEIIATGQANAKLGEGTPPETV